MIMKRHPQEDMLTVSREEKQDGARDEERPSAQQYKVTDELYLQMQARADRCDTKKAGCQNASSVLQAAGR